MTIGLCGGTTFFFDTYAEQRPTQSALPTTFHLQQALRVAPLSGCVMIITFFATFLLTIETGLLCGYVRMKQDAQSSIPTHLPTFYNHTQPNPTTQRRRLFGNTSLPAQQRLVHRARARGGGGPPLRFPRGAPRRFSRRQGHRRHPPHWLHLLRYARLIGNKSALCSSTSTYT